MTQSFQQIELIIVDDGSTDASPEIIAHLCREFPDRIRQMHQSQAGPYAARNYGLSIAAGDYIGFLDADDWWSEDCVEKLASPLRANRDTAIAYCGWQNVGLQGGRGEPHIPPDFELEDKASRFLRAAAPWPIHAALVRRSVLDQVGGFDLDLPSCMDYALWLRTAVARPICLVPEVLAFYRHHDSGQITSAQWRQAINTWLVKRKFIREHPDYIRHIPQKKLKDLVDGALLKRGYDNFWRRDLESAQKIFRMALIKRAWNVKDLGHLLPALLPPAWYRRLVRIKDR